MLTLALGLLVTPVHAKDVRIAVATNFTAPAKDIAKAFTAATGYQTILSFGSTGKLYTQIVYGAPFDVFLAADTERPDRLLAEDHAVADSAMTYATGRLALFSRDPGMAVSEGMVLLADPRPFTRLAIANPDTAPYGAAALEVLEGLTVLDALRPTLVRGDNIGQTYQFVSTGNAQVGFVALSQVIGRDAGVYWLVPEDRHAPLYQDAVLLQRGAENPAAQSFLAFLASDTARSLIEGYGYGVPEAE